MSGKRHRMVGIDIMNDFFVFRRNRVVGGIHTVRRTDEIKEPDDDLLSALLVKLFMDRQINITPEIINYILANMQRSFAYAKKLVAEIDTISLAQKRAVSIPIVKEALENLSDNKQGELFSFNNGQGELF